MRSYEGAQATHTPQNSIRTATVLKKQRACVRACLPAVDWSSVCPFDWTSTDRGGLFNEVLVRGGLRSVNHGSALGSAEYISSTLTHAAQLSEEEVAVRKQAVVKMLRAVWC